MNKITNEQNNKEQKYQPPRITTTQKEPTKNNNKPIAKNKKPHKTMWKATRNDTVAYKNLTQKDHAKYSNLK